MSLRDKRQAEFADLYWNSQIYSQRRGILYLCPRFGKCRVAINVFKKMDNPRILIAYPDNNIKKAWKDDMEEVGYKNKNVTFTTHLSLKKHMEEKYDIIVLDEIHLLSEAQIQVCENLECDMILGLTGTMSAATEATLFTDLKMRVIARYPIEKAIEEGIVTDYQITVKMVDLDDKVKNQYKNSLRTEKAQFDAYGFVIDKLTEQKKDTFFLRLARMRIIQNSLAKLNATKRILKENKDERILVFCGLIDTAEKLGCPVHHSKNKNVQAFDDFADGIGNHYAVVKIGNTGKTYKPLDKVVVNYFDSNSENLAQKILRCMAMEYNTPGKKAHIWLVSSTEKTELKWLEKALEFLDPGKIKYEKY